jgi:hypothetical protein
MCFMACVELPWRVAMQLEMNFTSLPRYAVTGRLCALCYPKARLRECRISLLGSILNL